MPPNSDQILRCSEMTLSAMCGRLRVGKGFLHVCSIGRCSHVFGLLVRHTWPLAIMPSADQVPVISTHSRVLDPLAGSPDPRSNQFASNHHHPQRSCTPSTQPTYRTSLPPSRP